MAAAAVLIRLRAKGCAIRRCGGSIVVSPSEALTDDDRAALHAHKAALLALLADLESLEHDGVAFVWRSMHEYELSDADRERLAAEAAGGDQLAQLVYLAVTRPAGCA